MIDILAVFLPILLVDVAQLFNYALGVLPVAKLPIAVAVMDVVHRLAVIDTHVGACSLNAR